MPSLDLAIGLYRQPAHTVSSKLKFGGGFIGGFRWAAEKISITTVRLNLEQIQLVSKVELSDVRGIGLQGA